MKKLFTLSALILVLLCGTTSCTFIGKSRLKLDIEASNKDCPIEVDGLGTLESITYDEDANMVVFRYRLSSDNKEIFDMMQADSSFAGNMLRIGFSDQDSDIRNCLEMVVKANGGMRAVFSYKNQEITAELSNAECRDMLNNPPSEKEQDRMMLSTVVNAMNATCPIDLGDGMIIERIYDDGTDIVFSVEAPDSDVAALGSHRDELRNGMLEILSSDEDTKELVQMCVSNARGIVYRFVGKNSGRKVNTRFSPEQLRSM